MSTCCVSASPSRVLILVVRDCYPTMWTGKIWWLRETVGGASWASFWLSLEIFRGRERWWATERGGEGRAEFPFWPLFFLACLTHCQGVCAKLGLGPGRRQSQGGPASLPAGRRCQGHFRDWQARGAGLSALRKPLAGKALIPLLQPWPCCPLSQSL